MKSVLISIQPKWCELIALGKKTVEVRKTKPKLETPFKVYIYCTEKDYDKIFCVDKFMHKVFLNGNGKHKVIGEFVCDEIFPIRVFENGTIQDYVCHSMTRSCVPYDDIVNYIGNGCSGYGWHISDLVIYDEPKELSEFFHYCGDNPKCDGCEAHYFSNTECGKEDYCCSIIEGCKPLKRPPQSWCYVEKGE